MFCCWNVFIGSWLCIIKCFLTLSLFSIGWKRYYLPYQWVSEIKPFLIVLEPLMGWNLGNGLVHSMSITLPSHNILLSNILITTYRARKTVYSLGTNARKIKIFPPKVPHFPPTISYVSPSKWQIFLQITKFPSHQVAELPRFSWCDNINYWINNVVQNVKQTLLNAERAPQCSCFNLDCTCRFEIDLFHFS